MKIEIMGYSGSGKSTLCRRLSELYKVPLLHIDAVHFLPNWQERDEEEKQRIVGSFLDSNPEGWVIDGNYTKLSYERRVEEADLVVQLLFSRINCLFRCVKRFLKYKGKSRPDMAEGCNEKLDWEFIKWILWEGRSQKARDRYRSIQKQYPHKVVVIRNQRQLNRYIEKVSETVGGSQGKKPEKPNIIKDLKAGRLSILIVVIYLLATNLIFGTVCPSRIIFHRECPGCGLTRSCMAILTGRWSYAWEMNASAFLWLPLIAWLIWARYIKGLRKVKWEAPVIVVCLITIVSFFLK